jgi:hypothetical protein
MHAYNTRSIERTLYAVVGVCSVISICRAAIKGTVSPDIRLYLLESKNLILNYYFWRTAYAFKLFFSS